MAASQVHKIKPKRKVIDPLAPVARSPVAAGAGPSATESSIETFDLAKYRAMAGELEQSKIELRDSQRELQGLTGALLSAQEDERRGVSRELHDDIGQQLFSIAVDADALGRQLRAQLDLAAPAARTAGLAAFDSIQTKLSNLMERVRRTAHLLHPSAVSQLGLGLALKSYCAEIAAQETLQVVFQQRSLPKHISEEIGLCCYRVVQEALRNVVKHSGTRRAEVTISAGKNKLQLVVKDDGKGFDPSRKRNSGLGFISMEERVRLVGGTFNVEAAPGAGVVLQAIIPLETGSPTKVSQESTAQSRRVARQRKNRKVR